MYITNSVAVIAVVAVFFWLTPSVPAGGVATATAGPLWKIRSAVGVAWSGVVSMVHSKIALVVENNELRREVADLQGDRIVARALSDELRAYRLSVGRSDRETYILGSILTKPPLSPYDTFMIDVGYEGSVSVGDLVVSPGGVALGFVDEVYQEVSRARLFSSPGVKHTATFSEPRLHVEVIGKGGGMFTAVVPRDTDIQNGAVALLPQFQKHPFAELLHSVVSPADAMRTLYLRNPVNVNELGFVYVVATSTKAR
jgi:cell shape-determining protein MreC